MPIDILMPALSPTMEEGNLAKWLVKEGDSVSSGDILAEIETDKATMEVEAVDEGVIGKILVEGGTEGVKVNEKIAILLEEGEDASAIDAAASAAPAAPAPSSPAEAAPVATPSVTASAPAPAASKVDGNRVFSSPLARRIASQEGLDIAAINGTGPRGRVVKRDVEAAIAAGPVSKSTPATTAPPASAPAPKVDDEATLKLFEEGTYELVAHDGMRKTIAKRLTEATQTTPSYVLTVECNLDALMKLRADVNSGAPVVDDKPAYKVSVNDFIVKAMALALKAVPSANASWTADQMIVHKHADVGVAVAIEGGLFTPIVRKAEEKTITAISNEIKDMAKRAKSKKLAPTEYQGGSTAVSNLGMFGVKEFTSIINPPHASIVSIGAGEKRPIVKDGELAVATLMTATFAFDHRVIDGAVGAELAAAFKSRIENPFSMLV